MGQGRGGFYSHDRLERLVGADIRNAKEGRDRALMGELRIGTVSAYAAWATTALIAVTVVALGVFSLLPGR